MIPFILPVYRRAFYDLVREYLNPQRPHQRNWLELGHSLTLPLCTFQLLFIAFLMHNHFPPYYDSYVRHDVLCSVFKLYSNRLDKFVPVLIWLFALFYHILEYYTTGVDTERTVWRFWYELVVLSQDDYYKYQVGERKRKALVEQKIKKYSEYLDSYGGGRLFGVGELLKKFVFKKFASIEMFIKLENVDREKLFQKPLSTMPYLSEKTRQKILINMIIFDYYGYVVQILFVIITILFYIVYGFSYPNWSTHPLPAIALIAYEVFASTLVGIPRMIRYSFFYIIAGTIGTIVFTSHAIEMRQVMEKLVDHCTKRKRMLEVRYRAVIDWALREHVKVCYLVEYGSDLLFGKIIYTFMLTMIPINVFIVRRLVFDEQTPMETFIFWLVCFLQLIIGFGILNSLSWCCTIYHRPKKVIPRLQRLMAGHLWRYSKLKYDDLYGRLMHGPKIALAIGPINSITYLSSLELLFTYVAYLLMAFSYEIGKKII